MILFLGIKARSAIYKYENGKVVYDIQLNRPSDANGKKFNFLNQLLKEASFEYSIYFSPTVSVSGSSSDVAFTNNQFKWDGDITIRKNELSTEIWKKYGLKSYYMTEGKVSIFKKYTGSKKSISGFSASECVFTDSYGQQDTGWVTKDLPKTAGFQLLQDCDFALIAFKTGVSRITLKKIDNLKINWSAVWQSKPTKHLGVTESETDQYIQNKKIVINEYFPQCKMVSNQGKKMTNEVLKGKKTLFFFCDPLTSESGSGILNSNTTSRDERYLKAIYNKLGSSVTQVFAIIPHYKSEIEYLSPALTRLKNINLIADPFNKIFGNLNITDYPFGILVNSKGRIEWADTCFSEEEVQAMIAKSSK